jgi:predicted KAP-like P-loop ATPase
MNGEVMISIIKYIHVEHELDKHMFDKNLDTMLSKINTCIKHSVVDKLKQKCLDPIESTIGLISNAITAHEEKHNKDKFGMW